MNTVEIEEAISTLAGAPFDADEFPYALLPGAQATQLALTSIGDKRSPDDLAPRSLCLDMVDLVPQMFRKAI